MKIRTVFKEDIEVDDKIMYIYKASGITHICFGKVLETGYKDVQYFSEKQPYLRVHKTYEITDGRRHKACDVKVTLTSPIAFKCGVTLEYPE